MAALARSDLLTGNNAITVGMLLQSPRFGRKSLVDLMCVTEAALESRGPSASPPSTTASPNSAPQMQRLHASWDAAAGPLGALLSASREFRGATTLGEALQHDLAEFARMLGIAESLDSIPLDSLVGTRGVADTVIARLDSVRASTPPSWGAVIEHRLLSDTPKTLEAIGHDLHVTRERVRQLQKRATQNIQAAVGTHITIIAHFLQERLPPVIAPLQLDEEIAQIFPIDIGHPLSNRLARKLLRASLPYSCVDSGCLSENALEVVAMLRSAAVDMADDVGLIEEQDLRTHLPTPAWEPFVDVLLESAGLHRVLGRLALRSSGKAFVKAAVYQIGRPATKEEIAEIVGIAPSKVGAHLSVIPSIDRADKHRWGMAEWIDDVYEGIPAEIVQRIKEDGGATRLERLLEELPRMFGVSETSVRIYARTPYFVIHNGYVSVASEPRLTLRELDDVIDGRTEEGVPYWTFAVESRYFDGYSIAPFPPELARELGCEPDGSTLAEVDYPEGASAVSVSWPLTSTTGANVGRISDSLRRLEIEAGARVRLLVKGVGHVEFRPSPSGRLGGDGPPGRADEILERIKSRRRVF